MTEPLAHDRCSELLARYVGGELDRRDRLAVERHLEGCSGCAEEHRAVAALASVTIEPLTDNERAGLHRAIELERQVSTVPSRSSFTGWQRRLAPALGAAGLIALLAVAGAYLGGRGDDLAPQLAGGDQADDAAGGTAARKAKRGGAGAASVEAATTQDIATENNETATNFGLVGGPIFEPDAGRLSARSLRVRGRGDEFVAFSRSLSVRSAARDRRDYLDQLVSAAEERAIRDQVRECAAVVFASNDYAIVPVFGAQARLDDRPVVVLGFVWSESDSGPLHKFMFWAWPRADCGEVPVAYEAGLIRPQRD